MARQVDRVTVEFVRVGEEEVEEKEKEWERCLLVQNAGGNSKVKDTMVHNTKDKL